MNYFSKKLQLQTLIGCITKTDNNDITQIMGLHAR